MESKYSIFEGRRSSAALGGFRRRSHGGLLSRVRAVPGDLGQRSRKFTTSRQETPCEGICDDV